MDRHGVLARLAVSDVTHKDWDTLPGVGAGADVGGVEHPIHYQGGSFLGTAGDPHTWELSRRPSVVVRGFEGANGGRCPTWEGSELREALSEQPMCTEAGRVNNKPGLAAEGVITDTHGPCDDCTPPWIS